MINKFSVLNEAKYFSSGIFQNYLLFISAKKHIECFSATTRIDSWKPNGMSRKYWKYGLQTWNFVKKWLRYRCFPVNVVNILRTAFSIEHHWWLLLLRSKGKNFKWKKKIKTFHLNYTCNYVNIRTDCPFSLTFSSNFLSFDSILCFYFLQTEKYIFLHLLVFSEAGIENYSVKQLFGKIEPKLLIFFTKLELVFSTVY